MAPLFSVILPSHEKDREMITSVIADFRPKLEAFGKSFEIITVITSPDLQARNTQESRTIVISTNPSITHYEVPQSGWGAKVRFGLSRAQGEYVCYTNAARTSADDLVKILKYAMVSNDVIVKATRLERANKMRKLVSIFYNIENRLALKTPIWDVNATPKVIPRPVLDKLTLVSDGDTIDAELMYKAFKKGVSTVEIPIRQTFRRSGKSTTNWLSAVKMFWGILKIKASL